MLCLTSRIRSLCNQRGKYKSSTSFEPNAFLRRNELWGWSVFLFVASCSYEGSRAQPWDGIQMTSLQSGRKTRNVINSKTHLSVPHSSWTHSSLQSVPSYDLPCTWGLWLWECDSGYSSCEDTVNLFTDCQNQTRRGSMGVGDRLSGEPLSGIATAVCFPPG